jgi:2-iminobutanoate/2-iminopropanoate deaminase
MNAIYAEFFSSNPPARSTIAVAGLPKNAVVEIEAVAVK